MPLGAGALQYLVWVTLERAGPVGILDLDLRRQSHVALSSTHELCKSIGDDACEHAIDSGTCHALCSIRNLQLTTYGLLGLSIQHASLRVLRRLLSSRLII